jgi:hypothetical protein
MSTQECPNCDLSSSGEHHPQCPMLPHLKMADVYRRGHDDYLAGACKVR